MNAQLLCGFGARHSEKERPYATIDFASIRALVDVPPSVDKLSAQWFIPSTLLTRTFQAQEETGEFWMLWADLDVAPLPLDAIATLISPLACDYEIYTSRSATLELPKSRILIPLAKPLSGVQWRLCQEVLNDTLQAGGAIPDRANERCGQLCFLPNRGAFYDARVARLGAYFDPVLFWADQIKAKQAVLLAQEQVIRERRELARARKASLSPHTTPSLIDAFNAAYPVEEILLCAGYEQRGHTFRHPNSQSGSYSASVKDGRVHSLSTSDLLYSDGQGAHDAFSAFTVLFAGGDASAALKIAGDEWLLIDGESWNVVQRREYAIAHAPELVDCTQMLINSQQPLAAVAAVASNDEKFSLDRFALNGESAAMEAQMLEDAFILGRLAILGQSTAIYAPPNAGKTLITLALIVEGINGGAVDPQNLYYINADDNFKGLVIKLKLAERYGFKMLAPHHKDFKLEEFCAYLLRLVKDQTARGVIVVLDTVKKFTDIMDKRISTNFGKVIRAFIQAGGSVIMLAHVNKHRDEDDKVVAAGTSDIIDDVDCAYTLDASEQAHGVYLATFENKKSRGDVQSTATYRYERRQGQEYEELLASVKEITKEELSQSSRAQEIYQSQQKNRELINVLISIMQEGLTLKAQIVKEAVARSDFGRDKFRQVLAIHTGEFFLMGHYWTMTAGEKNAQSFTLLKEYQKPIKTSEQAPAPETNASSANSESSASTASTETTASTASTASAESTENTESTHTQKTAANRKNTRKQKKSPESSQSSGCSISTENTKPLVLPTDVPLQEQVGGV